MNEEILPVSLIDKEQVINYIRSTFIPKQAERDDLSEKVLKVLHRVAVWGSKPDNVYTVPLTEGFIALYANLSPIPRDAIELHSAVSQLISESEHRFSKYGNFVWGNYRILGCFAANPRFTACAPETETYFTGAIPISTRDYQHPTTPLYYPPVFNIHKIMAKITDQFDDRFMVATYPDEIAKNVADFYFWGLVMTHPFWGGNHRGYDRFIEYAFFKKGLKIETPANETLNIPNNDAFNLAVFKERRRLLNEAGINSRTFNLRGWKDLHEWLAYQHRLNEFLYTGLNEDCAQTEEAAQAMLRWIK